MIIVCCIVSFGLLQGSDVSTQSLSSQDSVMSQDIFEHAYHQDLMRAFNAHIIKGKESQSVYGLSTVEYLDCMRRFNNGYFPLQTSLIKEFVAILSSADTYDKKKAALNALKDIDSRINFSPKSRAMIFAALCPEHMGRTNAKKSVHPAIKKQKS